jgi:hypothetical protein
MLNQPPAIRCPNCGNQVPAKIVSVVDSDQMPNEKVLLLSGNLNAFQCPSCGSVVRVAAPLMYHDAKKELLLAYVPPELNLPKQEREKVIGDMMRDLTRVIPQGSFKSYMFQPREALTMQGMMDTVYEAEGISPQMMKEQRERMALLEQILAAPPESQVSIIRQNDARIDQQLMQTLSLLIQRMASENQAEVARSLAALQQLMLENTTFGSQIMAEAQAQEAVVQEVTEALNALGERPTRADFLAKAIEYAEDEMRLQALVGLARPVFDYQFFEALTARIDAASGDEQLTLMGLREDLVELTQLIDSQSQAGVEGAMQTLQTLTRAASPEALDDLIRENLPAFDETFLSVLMEMLQQAEEAQNAGLLNRLQAIYARVMNALRDQMPPELRLVNEALTAPSEEEAAQIINAQARQLGPALLGTIDAVRDAVAARGEPELIARLAKVRELVADALR